MAKKKKKKHFVDDISFESNRALGYLGILYFAALVSPMSRGTHNS